MKRRELLIRTGAAAAGGLLAACGGGTPASSAPVATAAAATATAAPSPIKVKIGWVSVSAANSAIWSAEDGGYLKKYGLDADVLNIADSTQAVAAMLAGEVPLNCGLSGTAVVSSVLGGSDLVILAATVATFPNSLYGKADIPNVAALKGKKIGVTRIGTASDTAARYGLRSGGVDPKDVQFIQTGGLRETIAALQAGQIDAGALSPPESLIARGLGFKEIVDVGKLGIEYVYNGVVTSRAYAQKNSAAIEATLKAVIEGEHRFRTDGVFGKKVIADRTKLTDAAQVEETYTLFAKTYLKEPPFVTDAAIQNTLDDVANTNPKAKGADPKQFIDQTWMKKLEDSGFFKRLTP
jgi:ABC-type nitrate/sulfonate/bicarbonate transport system substrate-binding protein